MDPIIKKKVKHLDCLIAILTFACTVVFMTAIVIAIVLIYQIFFK
jgi:hypothetical protein